MTDKEKRTLDFIKKSITEGNFPTVREICAATGIPSTSTVSAVLDSLEQQGYIRRKKVKSRGIYLAEANITLVPLLNKEEGATAPYPEGEAKNIFAITATDDMGEIKKGDLIFFKECYVAPSGIIGAFESDDGITAGEVGKAEGAIIGRIIGFTRIYQQKGQTSK